MNNANFPLSLSDAGRDEAAIPVGSHWFGSWRLSVERKAFSAQEITKRYNNQALTWRRKLSRLGMPDSYVHLVALIDNRLSHTVDSLVPIRALDCGVGTADLPLALSRCCSTSMEFSAVDLSPQMLIQAKQTFSAAGLDADLQVADIRNLPYASNSFDLVIATHVLEHLPDPSDAFAEISRVLKPGGLILTCCTRRSLSGSMIQMKWRTHTVTQDQLHCWLSAHQFDDIEITNVRKHSLLDRLSLTCFANKTRQAEAVA